MGILGVHRSFRLGSGSISSSRRAWLPVVGKVVGIWVGQLDIAKLGADVGTTFGPGDGAKLGADVGTIVGPGNDAS